MSEFKSRRKNGEIYYEIKTITPLIGDDGTVTHFIETGKDITEHKLAEENFRASEQRNRALVEAIPDLLFRIRRDGTYLDYHAINEQWLFVSPDEFLGRKVEEVLPVELSRPYMDAVRAAFEQDTLQVFTYQVIREDRLQTHEVRIVANLAADEAVVIVRDITEQQQMEIELRHSEEKHRLLSEELEQRVVDRTAEVQDLYDNAPIGYHSLREDGTYQMINETELHWLGYTREEMVGVKTFGDLLLPESRDRYRIEFDRMKAVGFTYNLEFDLVRKDGSILPVIVNAIAVYDQDGRFLHTRSTMFNNTERKAIEAEIRRINNLSDTAFELAKAGYWYIPLDGSNYYYPSDRVIEIHGDEKHADHRYHLATEWLINLQMANPDLAARVRAAFNDILDGRSDHFDQQYPYRRPVDGKIIWIHAIGNVVRDSAGNRLGVSGVTQDITAQKEMERELNKAKEAAEAANMAKSTFLANMSHEIRTPMNAILGFAQIMMKEKDLDAKNREYIEIINRSGEHLLTLINEILEMSKIESGHVTYNPVTFHLPSLINDIRNMFLPRLTVKNLSMTVEMDPNLPKYISTDETKLKEILINLLGNAVKFTSQGGVT
ncbi:MAG: PAS domain S-box protein, partial [Anaerolineaceae bacterium]